MLDNYQRVALEILQGIGTPFSNELATKLRSGDWKGGLQMTVSPTHYSNAFDYLLDAQAIGLIKKCSGLPTGVDTAAAAHAKWVDGELSCKRSNDRLYPYLPDSLLGDQMVDGISEFLRDVRTQVRDWIGPTPPSLLGGRFGPGATYSDRSSPTVGDKISSVPSLTRDAVFHLPQFLGTWWGHCVAQHHGKVSVVRGNRFTTVPKTALIDRSIGVEPSVNVYFQLGYGRALRHCLRRNAGVDLTVAQDKHKKLAQESSRSFKNATIDLSNASDTICKNLVKILLPPAWYECLDDIRSKCTEFPGRGWRVLEKFSSMGNGFTFELETIIFAAISCVVAKSLGFRGVFGYDVHVYGDDIIVPDACFERLAHVLAFCGFTMNSDKSFHGKSPFRESCGGDYYLGHDVRPFYQQGVPDEPQEIIAFLNRLSSFLEKSGLVHRDHDFGRHRMLEKLPSVVRCLMGPKSLGDLVIHSEDRTEWVTKVTHGCQRIRVFRPDRMRVYPLHGYADDAVLASALYGVQGLSKIGGFVPRDGVLSYKVGWTALVG